MKLEQRKSALLSAIIKEHVQTADSVGSKAIVDKYKFKVSPATIRNEMVDLEKDGFIYQPHTSAGRIPTEKGWRFYIDNYMQDISLTAQQQGVLDQALQEHGMTYEGAVKNVAKNLADLSRDAVFVGFSQDNVYYTGLSQLFKHPEFEKVDLVRHISEVVDHLDEVINKLFNEDFQGTQVLIGKDNPFGIECSTIISRYKNSDGEGMFGILGPMRMDYENNIALVKYVNNIISKKTGTA
ncbi:MAG: hypothetical protein WCT27_03630 [Patescibacteria group bacterium]